MPAIGPKSPATPNEVIHVASNTDHETSDAGRQGSLVARFDNQVHVIPLDGEMNYPKALGISPRGATNGKTHGRKHVLATQRAKRRTERHVDGMARLVFGASSMGDRRAAGRRLTAGSRALAAPGVRERELLLDEAPRTAAVPAAMASSRRAGCDGRGHPLVLIRAISYHEV